MHDSIGLYAGNPVTQMGYKIGTVDRIIPGKTSVEVQFVITEPRAIPAGVKAVTRSTSILADRSLELVGNYESGPRLQPGRCIPLTNSSTPLSLSQVIGAATNFVNGINPKDSTNIQDALRDVDEAAHDNGPALNRLLTKTSALLDSPDRAIGDLGAIVRNLAVLSKTLRDNRTPAKQILLDMQQTTPDLLDAMRGTLGLTDVAHELIRLVDDLEHVLGDDIQTGLDTFGDLLRHLSPHSKGIANVLNPVPRFINTLSYYVNNHQFDLISWSPPLFRIRTPDGLALCGQMNASAPGSCADVNGQPHAVDMALLQYVLTEAQRR
ncbi:MlaD family protein [Mycobacterium arosiense]|uniref:Mammalian cell entry protein n=1 Tax=Mycobacterium arosiense ATCC BAA-1401 = DSM 45069 TaxID=1265311 RepID=A0A1W9ZC92_MYCAI|nr:MlaD family protein [Mycobacterium arosiense]ORA11434.1 mammalian cell entry protein [Mycobacterium arosiense ATCC BAA-1401 = DSM 45069]